MSRRGGWSVVLLALLALPARAAATSCPASREQWRVESGWVTAGRVCGSWWLSGDAAAARYSRLRTFWREPVQVPFEIQLTWRFVGPESRPLEISVIGAIVLFTDDHYGVYVDDAQFAADGWADAPGFDPHRESTVVVRQYADHLEILIDGKEVGRPRLRARDTSGRVGVGGKSAPAYRSRLYFRDVTVRALQ